MNICKQKTKEECKKLVNQCNWCEGKTRKYCKRTPHKVSKQKTHKAVSINKLNKSSMFSCKDLVKQMKLKETIQKTDKKTMLYGLSTLTEKLAFYRYHFPPQSTDLEALVRRDLKIDKPINEISGDGRKNGKNYEIKASVHGRKSKLNFVQIRPHHDIDFYLLIAYNMYDKTDDDIGKGYLFNIPADKVYDLVESYGGYAHGTKKQFGSVSKDMMKSHKLEYALRLDPNSVSKKNTDIWKALLQYEVEYSAENI